MRQTNEKLNVLYIITSANIGGAQVHLHDLISFLPQQIIPCVAAGEKGWLYGTLKNKNIDIYHIENLVKPISVLKDICALLELYKLVKKIKPDLIHCHSSKAGFLGRIVGKICGVPTIFTVHGWAFTEGVTYLKRIFFKTLERIIAKWTNRIICVSEYYRQLGILLMPRLNEKLLTIHKCNS